MRCGPAWALLRNRLRSSRHNSFPGLRPDTRNKQPPPSMSHQITIALPLSEFVPNSDSVNEALRRLRAISSEICGALRVARPEIIALKKDSEGNGLRVERSIRELLADEKARGQLPQAIRELQSAFDAMPEVCAPIIADLEARREAVNLTASALRAGADAVSEARIGYAFEDLDRPVALSRSRWVRAVEQWIRRHASHGWKDAAVYLTRVDWLNLEDPAGRLLALYPDWIRQFDAARIEAEKLSEELQR